MRWTGFIPLPTTRAIWLMILGMAAALFGGILLLVVVDLGILVIYGLDYFLCLRDNRLDAERRPPPRLFQDVPQEMEVVVMNRGQWTSRVLVRDHTPIEWDPAPIQKAVIQPRSSFSFYYRVLPRERGVYRFGDISLRVKGPLGLTRLPQKIGAAQEIEVYLGLPSLRYQDLSLYRRRSGHWGHRPFRRLGDGREFEALREYVEGDDPRKIHWKATARLDRPIVQEFQPEKNQIVMILLDAGRLMGAFSEGRTKLDHALEAAVQLAGAALSGGDQVGLLTFSDRVISFLPPKGTPEQLQLIMKETLSLQPQLVESRYEEAMVWLRSRIKRRCLVVTFTDLLDDLVSENLLTAVSLLRPRHLPLCVAIRESEWDDALKKPPSHAQGVYELAVLQETVRQRKRGLKGLTQKGALTMDLTPGMLSAGTLERYMEVKRRGLL